MSPSNTTQILSDIHQEYFLKLFENIPTNQLTKKS